MPPRAPVEQAAGLRTGTSRLSLGGRWKFCAVGDGRARPGTVPGSVHASLVDTYADWE